jgi:hypothetical protein
VGRESKSTVSIYRRLPACGTGLTIAYPSPLHAYIGFTKNHALLHSAAEWTIDSSQGALTTVLQNSSSYSLQESAMLKLPPLAVVVYKAYLRSRLDRCSRELQIIAAQRENDFHAERILHREVVVVRSKLQSL